MHLPFWNIKEAMYPVDRLYHRDQTLFSVDYLFGLFGKLISRCCPGRIVRIIQEESRLIFDNNVRERILLILE
jgi:hypothetical protein